MDLTQEALKALSKVRSWRTGLCADEVFRNHLQRALKAWR